MPQNPTINVMNRSTVLNDTAVKDMMNAVQYQVTHDFAPRWGIGARFHFVGLKEPAPLGAWSMVILDTSDVAGALGYHDLTPDGFPIGKVFAKTTLQYGGDPCVTLSHEVLEALSDPHINLTVQGNTSTFYAYENCDAVEADNLAYRRVGKLVSDFVLPEYFDPQTKLTSLSFKGNVQHPFDIAAGGYMSFWTPSGGWQQQTNFSVVPSPKQMADAVPRVGSRRERRARPRHEWQRSVASGPVLAEPEL